MPGLEKKTKQQQQRFYYFKAVPLYQTLSPVEGTCFEVYEFMKRIKVTTLLHTEQSLQQRVLFFTYRRKAHMQLLWCKSGVSITFFFLLTVQAIRNGQKSSLSLHFFFLLNILFTWKYIELWKSKAYSF